MECETVCMHVSDAMQLCQTHDASLYDTGTYVLRGEWCVLFTLLPKLPTVKLHQRSHINQTPAGAAIPLHLPVYHERACCTERPQSVR